MNPESQLKQLMIEALQHQATDIHFTMRDDGLMIEMRTMKGMRKVDETVYTTALFNYLKYIAELDLADTIKPQTGTFQLNLAGRVLFLRFALINSQRLTSGVLRILYQKVINEDLSPFFGQNRLFKTALRQTSGLIILSGPTGSGKTSSAYALLRKLENRKIFTIEDPIEMVFDDLVQIQVNTRQGITYESGIKQLLRHDPDVIFIGEIRDRFEARMAVRCALTGHLVITTIHSRDCVGVLRRLSDLDVDMYDLNQTLIMVSNQRLYTARYRKDRLCLYETMDRKELDYFHENGVLPTDHRSLAYYFTLAQQRRLIAKNTVI